MMAETWTLKDPALKLCDIISEGAKPKLVIELLRLDDATSGIVFDLDGIDYILTMQVVPKQRPRSPEGGVNDNSAAR